MPPRFDPCLYSLKEIANEFNNVTYSTVSVTIQRARNKYRLANDIAAIKMLFES